MKPKVSIIVPIYKTEKYLDRCMESILNQTLKEIEIILVDDDSPDSCPQLCERYKLQDSRIKVIHKKNGGLGFARNTGIEHATGEFVAFLDSDDFVDKKMYEKLYNATKINKSDTCLCGRNFYNNGIIVPVLNPEAGKTFTSKDICNEVLFNVLGASPECKDDNKMGMAVWAGIYSLDLIKKYNIIFCSERDFICEDAIFHIDYFPHSSSVTIIKEALYYYCENSQSLSRVFRKDRFEKDKILYHEEKRRLDGYGLLENGKVYIDRMFLTFARVFIADAIKHCKMREAYYITNKVVRDSTVKEVARYYPYKRNPLKQRIFNWCLRNEYSFIAFTLLKIATSRK